MALAGGDVLLLRTGWVGWYERQPQEVREALGADRGDFATAGLSRARRSPSGCGTTRSRRSRPTTRRSRRCRSTSPSEDTWLHYRLLPLLGLPLGEMFFLDALAADCARTGCYEGLFTSAPLNARGGSGSPANALAIL